MPIPDDMMAGTATTLALEMVQALERYFRSRDFMRRGICLLNAGCYDDALLAFAEAQEVNPKAESLPEYLTQCYIGKGDNERAAEQIARTIEQNNDDITAHIRHALLLMRSGKANEAITALRDAIAANPDCAELHYQLGNILAAVDQTEEAEDRFTQAVTIDNNHADALVGLALCCGARQEATSAVRHLARAQRSKPNCPRIARLLTLAAQAAQTQNVAVDISTKMPIDSTDGDSAIGKLASILENDPEFADALMDLPNEQGDDELYAVLTLAIEQALHRKPDAPELHFQLGRALYRLDKRTDAVSALEKAVEMKPDYVRALIKLANIYAQTDRYTAAAERLEHALSLGAEYADVYYTLGCAYQKSGQTSKARQAYENALRINGNYKKADRALMQLSNVLA